MIKRRVCRLLACVLLVTALLGTAPASASAAFADVPAGSWAEASINRCVQSGLFQGETATRFGMGKPMTRAAFTVVLCRFFGWELIKPEQPTYEDVKYQRTGHRETIRIDYNSEKVTFESLLQVFLSNIDPFDPDGQFIDRGHSYTLAVYYLDDAQKEAAMAAIRSLESSSGQKVCISVEPFVSFYAAEEEHQDFYLKNPEKFRQELIESGRIKE